MREAEEVRINLYEAHFKSMDATPSKAQWIQDIQPVSKPVIEEDAQVNA